MDRSKSGHRVLRGKVVMRCLLNSLPQVTCVLLWTLFASSFWAAVLSLHVEWEKSQLKAEVCYAMWRGSLLWTLACYSNDLIHLLQPSLLPRAEGQTRPEQNDETALSEWSTTEQQQQQQQQCFSVIYFLLYVMTEQQKDPFFYSNSLHQKNNRTAWNDWCLCFADKRPVPINEQQRQKLLGFALTLFRRRSGWLFGSSKCVTSAQETAFTSCFLL